MSMGELSLAPALESGGELFSCWLERRVLLGLAALMVQEERFILGQCQRP